MYSTAHPIPKWAESQIRNENVMSGEIKEDKIAFVHIPE